MFLSQFYQESPAGIQVAADQASRFAKEVAGDFNPIHNVDAKRFCVPGDLLFALVLAKYGLSQQMRFAFAGMVGHGVVLQFPVTSDSTFVITDDKGKNYLEVERAGAVTHDKALIDHFVRQYVAFSGQNFPHVLVPLMASQGVMLNTERPLVIYESMAIHLDRLDSAGPRLEPAGEQLQISGKRGDVELMFRITAEGEVIGRGVKKLVVSGLKPYDAEKMEALVDGYLANKQAYESALKEAS